MSSLAGKAAIVTGGGTGLGAAVCLGLARRGCAVVVNYSRSRDEADDIAARCEALGVSAAAIKGDVGDDDDCRHLVAEAVARFGRLDILVNNAARTKIVPPGDLDALNAEAFLDIYRTNVVGPYQMIRAAAPHLKAEGLGAVVNVSSIGGLLGIGSCTAYAASKGALNTMTLALARALGPEIRVNAVLPGFIGSRWFADPLGPDLYDAFVDEQARSTVLKRAGKPEDIAKSVLFLCDEGAEHLTGISLISDAGSHLGPAAPIPTL